MKRIELSKSMRCWVAETLETRDGESSIPDQELVRLFGTHILPTAYTNHATAETVLRGIRSLNPDAIVELA